MAATQSEASEPIDAPGSAPAAPLEAARRPILAFGIPSLDELLGHPTGADAREENPEDFGILLKDAKDSTSLCLIGPDGTGKSVLALHLASQYAALAESPRTRILYASTDLSFAKARAVWENFALGRPADRIAATERLLPAGRARARKPRAVDLRVELDRYQALEHSAPVERDGDHDAARPLADYLTSDPRIACEAREKLLCRRIDRTECDRKAPTERCHRVAFVDIESMTAGDDWGLINRLLSTLDRPDDADERHLLIVDAVEGLETLGGKRDIFGQERERRSRIAQVLRAAKGKCHVVFIVEEPREHERLPEEFVTDAVIRLRVEKQRDYARRTIEIEKLRGQAYVRGQHECAIRRGAGSQTGRQPNPDHPDFTLAGETSKRAYFLVMHSLHYLSREVMESPAPTPRPPGAPPRHVDPRTLIVRRQPRGLCGFGIRYLDEMVGDQAGTGDASLGRLADSAGLPWGSTTALIGDEGTHKGRVGRAFLAQAFLGRDGEIDAEKGVALLLTTHHIDRDDLAAKFLNHHGHVGDAVREWLQRLPDAYVEIAENLETAFGSLQALALLDLPPDINTELQRLLASAVDLKPEVVRLASACDTIGRAADPAVVLEEDRLDDLVAHLGALERLVVPFDDALRRLRDLETGRDAGGEFRAYSRQLAPAAGRFVEGLAYARAIAGRLRAFVAMRGRIVCRRLEIHHMTSAALFNIVHALVQRGLEILRRSGAPNYDAPIRPEQAPGRVRLVIDDWSSIQDAYPEIKADPLFLPFLIFYLKRQGITTLIIDTQPGRLSHVLTQESDRELRALVPHHLYTWYVTFYGERRVAIAALPPISEDKPVVVRELRPYKSSDEEMIVDPHFEFYAGFEHDAVPSPVPLQVRLYRPDDSPEDYLAEIASLFGKLYGPASTPAAPDGSAPAVVRAEPSAGYEALRDFTYLQGGAALDHTLVLLVDEFWSQDGEALSDLGGYLRAETWSRGIDASGKVGIQADAVEDPFRLFQPSEKTTRRMKADGTADLRSQRHEAFSTVGYRLVPPETPAGASVGAYYRPRHDRVPYSVDFGFLLADRKVWKPYEEVKLTSGRTIGDAWRALTLAPTPDGASPERPVGATWREFFEACRLVAEGEARRARGDAPALPFDVDHTTVETFSCLVLELWATEVHRLGEKSPVFSGMREDRPKWGLLELMRDPDGRYRRALYRAWLLLNSAMVPRQLPQSGYRLLPSSQKPRGVACRHWYVTASPDTLRDDGRWLVPLRLPGWYTTRGDWFASVVAGSRSRRLGERAIDLLVSRRANITRMQTGLGLPVRGFPEAPEGGGSRWVDAEYRSTLSHYDDNGRRFALRLHDVWQLGGRPPKLDTAPSDDFFWLWRSRLKSYDRHSRIWSKWLLYAFVGFADEVDAKGLRPQLLGQYDDTADWVGDGDANPSAAACYPEFDRACDELREALERSTMPSN